MASILPLVPRAASAERASRPRVRLELTRRGRVLMTGLAFLLGIVVAIAVLLLVDGPWAFAGAPDHGATITVQAGDTLWSYAESYAPAGTDPQTFIEDVRRLNSLPTPRLTAGQEIVLPQSAVTQG